MKDGHDFEAPAFAVANGHEPPPTDVVEAPARIFGITPDNVLAPDGRLISGHHDFV